MQQDIRAQLIAAADAAVRAENTPPPEQAPVPPPQEAAPKDSQEVPADGSETPQAPTPKPGEEDTDLTRARVVARAREQAARIRAELDAERKRVASEREELERLRSEVEPWKARVQKFKEDPIAALEEAELSPQAFTEKVLLHGQPDPMKEKLAPLQKELESTRGELAELKQYMAALQKEREQQEATRAVEHFKSIAFNESKHPTLASAFKGREDMLVEEADLWTDRYKAKTGKWPALEDVAEFLEAKYASLVARPAQKMGEAQGRPSEMNGAKRTLSANAASQKLSTPKPVSQMSAEELRDAQKRAADDAVRLFRAAEKK